MGQNTLKSTIFSLLDFSVLQPFGDANVQFWKTKGRLIQGERAFITYVSSRIDIFRLVYLLDWQGSTAFLTDAF